MNEDLLTFYRYWLTYPKGSAKVSEIRASYCIATRQDVSIHKVGKMLVELQELGFAGKQVSDGLKYWYRLDLQDKARHQHRRDSAKAWE